MIRKYRMLFLGAVLLVVPMDIKTMADGYNVLTGKNICKLVLSGPGEVHIFQVKKGEQEYFYAQGKPGLLRMSIRDNVLLCKEIKKNTVIDQHNKYYIGLRNICAVSLIGNIKGIFATNIITPFLRIDLADNASLTTYETSIKTKSLEVYSSDNSMAWFAGEVPFQLLHLSSHARYNALCMKTQEVYIKAVDQSIAELTCAYYDNGKGKKLQGTLSGIVSGKSKIWLHGNPRKTKLQFSDASCVQHIMQ